MGSGTALNSPPLKKIRPEIPVGKRTTVVLRDDFRLLAAWIKGIKDGTFKAFSEKEVRGFARDVIGELFRRQDTTFRPDKMTPLSREFFLDTAKELVDGGLIIVAPFAEKMIRGDKKLVIKSRPFDLADRPFWLTSGRDAWGIVTLGKPKKISLLDFARLEDRHLIDTKTREKFWPGKKEFWSYPFTRQAILKKPIAIVSPRGPQVTIRDLRFKSALPSDDEIMKAFHGLLLREPKDLSDAELLRADRGLHGLWRMKREGRPVRLGGEPKSNEDLINLHVFLIKEIRRRGMEHPLKDDFDKQTGPFLKGRDLAPVGSSGVEIGGEIVLTDVLGHVKSFFPHPVFAWIVGGLANRGRTKGDIDVLWRAGPDLPEYLKHILAFRFGRQMPGDLARRVQHHWDVFHGPFTRAVPIYALLVERINQANEVKEASLAGMGAGEDGAIECAWDEERGGWTVLTPDEEAELSKAQHLGLPPLADGRCPAGYPIRRRGRCFRRPGGKLTSSHGSRHAGGATGPKLTNDRARLRPANPGNPGERCGFCRFFVKPEVCKIVAGPVSKDLVCDWIQSRDTQAPLYSIANDDWLAFGRGMIDRQPYQHIVRDAAITPEGPLVLIKDTARPPHFFSLSKDFHVKHTSLEHHWTQAEVDDLVQVGRKLEKQLRSASPDIKRQAAASEREDEIELFKQLDQFLITPPEDETFRFVYHQHWRGKSEHGDLRLESEGKDFLVGWTVAELLAGVVKEPIDTFAKAKVAAGRDWYKIDWRTGRFKTRRTRAGNIVPAQIRAFPKAKQPRVWLRVEGKTGPFPASGSTRQFPGIFFIRDKGIVEYGTQKPDTHEYFLRGDKLQGRLVIRRIPRQVRKDDGDACADEELRKILPPGKVDEERIVSRAFWVTIQPLDQTPIVLSERERDKFIPPQGVSALPRVVRRLIPDRFRYWTPRDEKKRFEVRNALLDALKAKEVEIDFNAVILGAKKGAEIGRDLLKQAGVRGRFSLQRQEFQGPFVIRGVPTTVLHTLRFDFGKARTFPKWEVTANPIEQPNTSAIELEPERRNWLRFKGDAPPGHPLNPTKNTPSTVDILDEGDVLRLVDREDFKRWEFKGRKLRGSWIARRSKGAQQWDFMPARTPVARKAAVTIS